MTNLLNHTIMASACSMDPAPTTALDIRPTEGLWPTTVETLMDIRIRNIYVVGKSDVALDKVRGLVTPYSTIHSKVDCWVLDLNKPSSWLRINKIRTAGTHIVTCQQMVGYLRKDVLLRIPFLLAPGGVFLFDSPLRPNCLYRSEDSWEIRAYLGRIFCLKARWPQLEWMSFRWHDIEKDFRPKWEDAGYQVQMDQSGQTLVTVVRKQPTEPAQQLR